MCQSGHPEMFRRLVLVVENQILQDDHEVWWIAIQCNKIGLSIVWTPYRLNDGPSGGTCFYTHFSNVYIDVDLSMVLWKSLYSWIIAPFEIILPTDDGFYSDGISIKLFVLPAMSKIRYCFVKHSILFFLILFAERFLWSQGGLLSPSNFGLKTTPANKFDKGDQACLIGLYAEYPSWICRQWEEIKVQLLKESEVK